MIKVSVIIPIYNMMAYLKPCLDSVFSQTLQEIEVICVDDGSTDGSLDILDSYAALHDNLIVLHQKREGAGAARNKGIKCAKGEYIAFMDSDDYYPSNQVLELLYGGAKANGLLMAGGSMLQELNGYTRPFAQYVFNVREAIVSFHQYQNCYGFYRFIYNTQMLKDKDIFFPNYSRQQDPVFMLKAMVNAKEMWITSEYTYVYREFDKFIDFSGETVICDFVRAYLEMMKISFREKLFELQNNLLKRIESHEKIFLGHIYAGNNALLDILRDISSFILDPDNKGRFVQKWGQVDCIIAETIEENAILKKVLKEYDSVIIYGAGDYGKYVYDFVSHSKIKQILFAISYEKPSGTVRGQKVYCIDQLTEYKEKALVIIAVNDENAYSMREKAISLGYTNLLLINHPIVDIENFKVTNHKFAVK
ncbi:MAG: glycosyltransferase family 2 protein [Lachnospiraceae bacterium]